MPPPTVTLPVVKAMLPPLRLNRSLKTIAEAVSVAPFRMNRPETGKPPTAPVKSGKVTRSLEPGRPAGVQLEDVFQLALVLPF